MSNVNHDSRIATIPGANVIPEEYFTRVAVVGAGRLGASLARAVAGTGRDVVAVASRDASRAQQLAASLGPDAAAYGENELHEAIAVADAIFLTVPDGAVHDVAARMEWRQGQAAIHCSGALGLDVLGPAVERGALTGCLHPLQSFSSAAGEPQRFRGVTCGIEAAEPLGSWLESLALDLGSRTVRLEGVDRALYHAAAVVASNDVVALMSAASRTWGLAGLPLDEARDALAPLLRGAAENISAHSLPDALTGPVKRGDAGTVERHLEALAGAPDLLELYRRLGAELLRLDLGLAPEIERRLSGLLGD